MVRKVDGDKDGERVSEMEYALNVKKGYSWYEMGFFTRWEAQDRCKMLCVDTTADFPERLLKAIQEQKESGSPIDLKDPLALNRPLLDLVVALCDTSVWRARNPVRLIEKVSVPVQSYPLLRAAVASITH